MIFILTHLLISISSSPLILQEKIEVKVGDRRIITTTDLDVLTDRLLLESPKEGRNALRLKARDALIDQALIAEYLAKYEMQVKDEELNPQIRSIRENYGYKSDEKFREFIEGQYGSFDRFRDQLRWQMERSRFYGAIQRQAAHTKDEKEVLDFYQRNKANFDRNLEIELEECVIPASETNADQLAASFRKNPKDFGICIKKWSKGPSAENGGKLGKFTTGVLPENLEQRVFALRQGEVLENRISTGSNQGDRIQLLKAVKVRDLGPRQLADVRKEIEEKLDQEKLSKEVARIISDLKANTFIHIF